MPVRRPRRQLLKVPLFQPSSFLGSSFYTVKSGVDLARARPFLGAYIFPLLQASKTSLGLLHGKKLVSIFPSYNSIAARAYSQATERCAISVCHARLR